MAERWLWTQKQDIGPRPRSHHLMAYDATHNRVVLFGGQTTLGKPNDTWEWDGHAWAEVEDTGPSGRVFSDMVYDVAHERLVLFGGAGENDMLGDTWEWDGEDWTQVADIGPGPRSGFAMAYHNVQQQVVIFGGHGRDASGTFVNFNDTWAWDGTDWTQISDTGPTPRRAPSMVFDSSRGCLVLFGGREGGTEHDPILRVVNDTWEWGAGDREWARVQDIGPQDFRTPEMVYTGTHTVLFGSPGEDPAGRGLTWEWDGRSWTQRQNMGPIGRGGPALAYNSQRDRVVLFGGLSREGGVANLLNDTWELAITEPPPT